MSNGKDPQTNFGRQDGVDLRTYFEAESRMLSDAMKQRIADLEEKINLRFDANRIAIDKQETANAVHFTQLNEWRQQNKDKREMYLTRAEYESKHELLCQRIASLEKIIFMGLGALGLIEFLFKFFVK